MKVVDMSVDELKSLIKEAIKEEKEELLDIKRRIFEFETLQALQEVKGHKVKAYDTVEEMLKDMKEE